MKLNRQNSTPVEITEHIEERAFQLVRFAGYILLLFSVVDYLAILIPPRLLDPAWEFETMGQLVDHIVAPLLGLVLVFLHIQRDIVSRRSLRVLSFLSRASLGLGIVYLLMLPLGITNIIQLCTNITANINIRSVYQNQQLEQVKQRIVQSNSPEELVALSKALSPGNPLQNKGNIQSLKTQLSQEVQERENAVTALSDQAIKQQTFNLIKAAVKVNIEAVLAGVSLIRLWVFTRWARMLYKNG